MTGYRLPLLATVLLAACSGGIGPVRYDMPPQAEAARIPVSVGSVEVREVSLPLYAGLETITVETAEGQLLADSDLLWADDPTRAVTQGLAVALAAMTNANVAAEPWPFSDSADVRLEVRFTRALAAADGQFHLEGQYFVASPFGERRDLARRFALSVPYQPEDLSSVARAKAAAIQELARTIARDGL